MPKVKYDGKGLVQEPGSGFDISGGATFTGATTMKAPASGSSGLGNFSLVITASTANDANSNAIILHGTGSDQGTDFGLNQTIPAGACAIFFDPNTGTSGSIKVKVGDDVYFLAMNSSSMLG